MMLYFSQCEWDVVVLHIHAENCKVISDFIEGGNTQMLDPTIYKDWQIAEEAEKTLPSVDYFREKLGLLPDEIIPYGKTPVTRSYRRSYRHMRNMKRRSRRKIPDQGRGTDNDTGAYFRTGFFRSRTA